MKPQMVEALYRISVLTDPDSEAVFQEILQAITDIYGGTMAMVNVLEGDCLRFRTIVNPHPTFQAGDTLDLQQTLCRVPLNCSQPLLIQNARSHPEFCSHLVVQLNLKRYLGVPICNSAGTTVGTLCLLDDHTEDLLDEEDIQFLSLLAMRVSAELEREQMLRNQEALLAEQEQQRREHLAEVIRFKAFVDSTADGIIAFDMQSRMTSWNGGAERIFGYSAQEAIGESYTLLGTPDDHDVQHRVYFETLRGDAHQWYDTRRRHKNGSIIDVSITTSPLMLEGEVVGLVAIFRDITEKVRAARELQERNAQLDALAQKQRVTVHQLAHLNAQLYAKAEEKRHFVNMVIHDLRHPLTAMRTMLHLLRIERSKKQRTADLMALENRTRALGVLLDELVLYDQIETGRSLLKNEPIDVGPFVRACVEEVAGQAGEQVVPVRCEIAPELGTVFLDGSKLRHILLNLVANALKFTQEGHITVRALPENAKQWRLEVEDTGIGMTSEECEHAFEEYFSGTNRVSDGIGLGLAIAHRLCTTLQAKVSVRSMPGQGTCFQLLFSRRLDALSESENSGESSEDGPRETHEEAVETVLTDPQDRSGLLQNTHFESLVQALLRATDYGVLVTDLQGNDIFCNPRFGTLFGVRAEEVVQLPREQMRQLALDCVQDPDAFTALLERAYARPLMEFQDEIALKRPKECILRRHSAPILGTDGAVMGRVWTFLDVTETRRLQSEVASHARRLEERLEQQAEELKTAQESLLEAAQMRAVGTLAMGIAHDLRNILTNLRLEMAAAQVPCQSLVGAQLDRMYALTHSLLALSDETHTHAAPVDLSEIVDFVFGLVRGQAEVDGVRLVKHARHGIAPAYGDARRLEHLVVNLLLNALNAVGPTGGEVAVTLTQEGRLVRIDVTDTGPGISPEHQSRLFEPFFTTRANRTGLGLFSARRIVEAHQGRIEIISEPGQGARVSVWLPTVETPSPEFESDSVRVQGSEDVS